MNRAFTLVELSIVLVIIGLLAGGVLVGQDLIQAAKLNKIITQKEEYDRAATTFRTKYNALPGDISNASNFGFSNTSNGTGDGMIGMCGANCSYNSAQYLASHIEYINFWYHLSSAGLIGGEYAEDAVSGDRVGQDSPAAAIGYEVFGPAMGVPTHGGAGGWAVLSRPNITPTLDSFSNAFILGSGDLDNITFGGSLAADLAYRIDDKADDGEALSGTIRGFTISFINTVGAGTLNSAYDIGLHIFSVAGSGVGVGSAGSDNCINEDITPNNYNVTNTEPAASIGFGTPGYCGLIFKASF